MSKFLKHNKTFLLILALFLVFATGAFATETGRTVLGQKQTSLEGEDNTLLLEVDLDKFDMDYTIARIEEDDSFYWVTYTYLDLADKNGVWQYQMREKVRKVTKKIEERSGLDLGTYLAGQLKQEYETRIRDLKEEQAKAEIAGGSKRLEVTQFSGLLGATLDLAGRVFPGYEPVTVRELPSPILPPNLILKPAGTAGASVSPADNLTMIYSDYIKANDPDSDNIFGSIDNCPNTPNPDQLDSDDNGVGDACDVIGGDNTGADEGIATGTDIMSATTSEETATGTEASAAGEETTGEEIAAPTEAVAPDNSAEDNTADSSADSEPDVEIIPLPQDASVTN